MQNETKRPQKSRRMTCAVCAVVLLSLFSLTATPVRSEIQADTFRPFLNVACEAPYTDPQRFRQAMPGLRILEHDIDSFAGSPGRARTVLLLAGGRLLKINALFPGNRLRRVSLELSGGKPLSSLSTDDACRITEAREIVYDDQERADVIRVYQNDLVTVRDDIPLNPPAPRGDDPGGINVGLIDSGVNYTLSPFKERLARMADGTLMGHDYWDGDDLPYDADTGRSPFFPLHHGSAVMSVLIREAPMARVLPVRYPRPDMSKMADAVAWLAERDVRIVNLAMGSNDAEEWKAFTDAAARHPRMLFIISAGNNGRNIDTSPVYPAASDLPNTIVVTSSEVDGRLAQGSNWGAQHVDIMTSGERIPVTDHRGAPGKASGSSFAVPRITALAVRALAYNPDWHGPELREWILKRARPLDGPRLTRYGWIPDPTDGP